MRDDAVLFIDDEVNIQRAFKRELHGESYEILTADSGEEGLLVQAEAEVGVVVSDHKMPGMTGVEFLEKVRQQWPKTFRIMLTGYGDIDTISSAINVGEIHRFLTKPWDRNTLKAAIDQGISHAALIKENDFLTSAFEEQNYKLTSLTEDLEKQVEERTRQLQDTYARLVRSERSQAIADLVEGVSRQAMNPLTVIGGRIDMIRMNTTLSVETVQMLDEARESVDQVISLLTRLRDVTTEQESNRTDLDFSALVNEVYQLESSSLRAKSIDMMLELEEGLRIRADENQIRQVLLSMINNAVDAMPGGGRVIVETRSIDQDGHAFAEVRVTDTGVGIPEEDRPKIFSPLFTTKAEGSGMGLPICVGIIKNHGGTMDFTSRVGEGTTFVLPA